MKNHSDSKSETRKLKGLTDKIKNDCIMEEAINSAELSETESRVMVSHGPMTHPLSESETCDFCHRVQQEFDKSPYNLKGERNRIIAELKEEIKLKITKLIAEECSIARQEGQPTSRLTSLALKISKI